MYYVYVLQSLNSQELYVGSSNDLKERFEQHNLDKVFSTKRYMPWKLIYYEAYIEENLARLREKRLKNHGNAIRELKKRIGLLKGREGVYPAPLFLNTNGRSSKIVRTIKVIPQIRSVKSGAGFTLIEILVVLGILSILASFGYLVTIDFYKSYAFNSERGIIVAILQKARSQSLANINESAHGVHFDPGQYVIFQGSAYNSAAGFNQTTPAAFGIQHSGVTDIVFAQLSGDPSPGGDLILSDGKRAAAISINNEGQINW